MVKRYAELVCNRLEVRIKNRTITKLKTLQALAAANELLQQKLIQKVLVIPPASLKYQWKNEIEKFSDYQAIVIDGTAAKRKKQYALF